MKIITQSTKVASQPYFHLAYLAASHTNPQGSFFTIGMLFVVTACAILIKPLISKTKRGFTSIKLSLRKKPKNITAGLCLLLLGAGLIVLSYKSGREVYHHPQSMTRLKARSLYHTTQEHLDEGQPIPENIEDMRKQWKLNKGNVQDGWFNTYKITKIKNNGEPIYHIISAGKDGSFGTQDDIDFSPSEENNN